MTYTFIQKAKATKYFTYEWQTVKFKPIRGWIDCALSDNPSERDGMCDGCGCGGITVWRSKDSKGDVGNDTYCDQCWIRYFKKRKNPIFAVTATQPKTPPGQKGYIAFRDGSRLVEQARTVTGGG